MKLPAMCASYENDGHIKSPRIDALELGLERRHPQLETVIAHLHKVKLYSRSRITYLSNKHRT